MKTFRTLYPEGRERGPKRGRGQGEGGSALEPARLSPEVPRGTQSGGAISCAALSSILSLSAPAARGARKGGAKPVLHASLLAAALLLGACEHLYGSMDAGRLAPATAPLGSR